MSTENDNKAEKTTNPTPIDTNAEDSSTSLAPTMPGEMRKVNMTATEWTERYRPSSLVDVLMPSATRGRLQSFLDGRSTVLLLAGRPGTGKTSIAKSLIADGDMEYFWNDCSDGLGIDFVNGDLMRFVATLPWEKRRKAAVLDEVDSMSGTGMSGLRGAKLEANAEICSFILICNDITKISAPIRSRCLTINVDSYTAAELTELRTLYRERIMWINEQENAGLDDEVVDAVIDAHFPSMRAMLKELAGLAGTAPDIIALRERLQAQQAAVQEGAPRGKRRRKSKDVAPDAAFDLSKTDWTVADKKFPMLPTVASPPLGGGAASSNAELRAILDEIVALLKRHLYLPDGAPEAIALYIVLSHMHEAARFSPLLLLTAAVMASGKTTALTLISRLVRNPTLAANITAAAMYRAASSGDALIIDEADTLMMKPGDMVGILNSGFTPEFAVVLRAKDEYLVWCPKIVAKNGTVHPTLASRSIIVEMRPPLPGYSLVPLPDADWSGYADLRSRIATETGRLIETFRQTKPTIPKGLTGRAADRWHPLLAIAELAGDDWAKRASAAALLLDNNVPDERLVLLADIRLIFDEGAPTLFSRDIVGKLVEIETSPWSSRFTGNIRQRGKTLAAMLKPFGIQPKQRRRGSKNTWGYAAADFEDAWARYLPPVQDKPEAEAA